MSDPAWLAQARSKWKNRGQARPPFAIEPGEGQESVWDYPRPPAIVPDVRRVIVRSGSATVADTSRAVRILETASPPTFYLPGDDVELGLLEPVGGSSFCEWKGPAQYWGLRSLSDAEPVAWSYPRPLDAFAAIVDHLAFYPGRIHCEVAGERVRPQPGGFYGGWITDELVGPFKGEQGTGAW